MEDTHSPYGCITHPGRFLREGMVVDSGPDVHTFSDIYRSNISYFVKLRPHAKDLLKHLSELFELHIFTFGVRWYAHKVAELLDPDKSLFRHRILSRDECFDPYTKTANLKALFPCGDNFVCIIDDREDVWSHAPNLVRVKPYRFWKNVGDINAPSAVNKPEDTTEPFLANEKCLAKARAEEPIQTEILMEEPSDSVTKKGCESLPSTSSAGAAEKSQLLDDSSQSDDLVIPKKSANTDVEEGSFDSKNEMGNDSKKDETNGSAESVVTDEDDYLYYLERILKRIHKAFYQLYDKLQERRIESDSKEMAEIPDLKLVLPYVQKKVLRGVRIVFSSVIPRNYDPKSVFLFNAAKAFGAEVQDSIIPVIILGQTTHLVARRPGTSKVREAVRAGNVLIVLPDWLISCVEQWERVKERPFLLFGGTVGQSVPDRKRRSKGSSRTRTLNQERSKEPTKILSEIEGTMGVSGDDLKAMNDEVAKELEDVGESSTTESEQSSSATETCKESQVANDLAQQRTFA